VRGKGECQKPAARLGRFPCRALVGFEGAASGSDLLWYP